VVYFNSWQNTSFLADLKYDCLHSVEIALGKLVQVDSSQPLSVFLSSLIAHSQGALLIILDQFEEYFLYHPEPEGERFDDELSTAICDDLSETAFLVSVRDDWLSKLDRFQDRIPNLLSNMLRLDHLNRAAGEAAIRMPLQVFNLQQIAGSVDIEIEDDLVKAVLNEIRAGTLNMNRHSGTGHIREEEYDDRIETAFLQLVLERIWDEERAVNSNILRLDTYKRLGGAHQIVQTHLDRVMNELGPVDLDSCARMFQFLVTPKGAKIAHQTADLVSYAARPEREVKAILEELASKRVLRRMASPERYEIFHDVLASAILDWRARRLQLELEQQAQVQRRAANRFRLLSLALAAMVIIVSLVALYARKKAEDAKNFHTALDLSNKDLSDAQVLYAHKDYSGARVLLQRLATAGNSKAMMLLGQLYEFGFGVKQDIAVAKSWYADGARLGDPNSMYNLALLYENGKGVSQDYAVARDWFKMAADTGHVASMYYLGVLYVTGSPTLPRNYAEARAWFQKAADQGHPSAMYDLALLYANGLGVIQNYPQALSWYQRAADLGHSSAMFEVGLYYSEGLGVPRNYKNALHWYARAADQGHDGAMFELGRCYSEGLGVEQDYHAAFRWYQKASDLGNTGAMSALGALYESGHGTERSYLKARQWFERAATLEDADAMYQLGKLYSRGLGVSVNYDTALAWFRKSLKAGNPAATDAIRSITRR
jgi:TPR repeat protein